MNFFYELWIDAGGSTPYEFDEEDVRLFVEPEAFTKLTHSCTKGRAQARFAQLRALKPCGDGS